MGVEELFSGLVCGKIELEGDSSVCSVELFDDLFVLLVDSEAHLHLLDIFVMLIVACSKCNESRLLLVC